MYPHDPPDIWIHVNVSIRVHPAGDGLGGGWVEQSPAAHAALTLALSVS